MAGTRGFTPPLTAGSFYFSSILRLMLIALSGAFSTSCAERFIGTAQGVLPTLRKHCGEPTPTVGYCLEQAKMWGTTA